MILRNKEIAKKAANLLLRTKSRPRFLPSNGPNMGFYGQIYKPGVSRKPLDQ